MVGTVSMNRWICTYTERGGGDFILSGVYSLQVETYNLR
jgi:hypothetical protein